MKRLFGKIKFHPKRVAFHFRACGFSFTEARIAPAAGGEGLSKKKKRYEQPLGLFVAGRALRLQKERPLGRSDILQKNFDLDGAPVGIFFHLAQPQKSAVSVNAQKTVCRK